MHPRQAIINKIVSLLTGITGVPTPKELDEKPAPALPMLRVEQVGETSDRTKSEMEDARLLRINIAFAVSRAPGFQTALNAIAELVEAKLAIDPLLDGTADGFEYRGMSADNGSVEDIDAARMTLIYEAAYIYTPTIAADDFLTMYLNIDMAGPRNDPQNPAEPDGQIDASATVILPT